MTDPDPKSLEGDFEWDVELLGDRVKREAERPKSDLRKEVEELQAQLGVTFAREKGQLEAQGKTLDFTSWLLGMPNDPKYPGGPPYFVSAKGCHWREEATNYVPTFAAAGGHPVCLGVDCQG